jgi:phospholipase/carboxylesterase
MDPRTLTRRELLRLASGALGVPLGASLAAVAASACGGQASERLMPAPAADRAPPASRAAPGVQPLGLGAERDGVLVVPEREGPVPLLLMLHGAGGTGRRAARLLGPMAAELGCAVLAPDSRGSTWDAVTGVFGPDVRFLERALAEAAARCEVAPGRLAAAGFSDGATYALALGRANGDRFSHLLAFSPGFLIPARRVGAPRIFVSHGRQDDVLPIASCSRVVVPRLRRDGYDVRYREFDGGHEVPPTVMREGVGFFLE